MTVPGDVLRTSKGNTRYFRCLKTGKVESDFLANCERTRSFKYWFITWNEYPYDRIAKKHDLLVPKRKFASSEQMTKAERDEFEKIKKTFTKTQEYDSVMENIPHQRTIRDWHHLHLIKFKGSFKLRERIHKN